jgi:hypothetical protein
MGERGLRVIVFEGRDAAGKGGDRAITGAWARAEFSGGRGERVDREKSRCTSGYMRARRRGRSTIGRYNRAGIDM